MLGVSHHYLLLKRLSETVSTICYFTFRERIFAVLMIYTTFLPFPFPRDWKAHRKACKKIQSLSLDSYASDDSSDTLCGEEYTGRVYDEGGILPFSSSRDRKAHRKVYKELRSPYLGSDASVDSSDTLCGEE